MIVASVNPQPQQTRADMMAHHQGSAVVNEPNMVKVHPLQQQPGAIDISVVPYETFIQHPYSQSSTQPVAPNACLPSHHLQNQFHDAVVLPSPQHLGQPPCYLQQQQPMPHPLPQHAPVQPHEGIVLPSYQQLSPTHDMVLSPPHQYYSGQPHSPVILAHQQNSYQPHDIVSSHPYIAQSHASAPLPGVLLPTTHQTHHPIHDGVLHPAHPPPPYTLHETLVSPSHPHPGLMQPPVVANPPLPSAPMPGATYAPPVPPQYHCIQPYNSVVHGHHQQHTQMHNGMIATPHQHTTLLHGTVVAPTPSQHPSTMSGGVVPAPHQYPIHNTMLPHAPMQGTVVPHQHHSPLHSAGVMPVHNQHPAAIHGQQHIGPLHNVNVPCSRQHPSNCLHSTVAPSLQQHPVKMLNTHLPTHPPPQQIARPNDTDIAVPRQLSSKLTEPVLNQPCLKLYDTSTPTSHQSTILPTKFGTTSLTTNSSSSETSGQPLSHHVVPIKKLGTLAMKSNGFNEPRITPKVGQQPNKECSAAFNSLPNSAVTKAIIDKTSYLGNCNNGFWEPKLPPTEIVNGYRDIAVMPAAESSNMSIERCTGVSVRSLQPIPNNIAIKPAQMTAIVNGTPPLSTASNVRIFQKQPPVGTLDGTVITTSTTTTAKSIPTPGFPKTETSLLIDDDIDALASYLERSRLQDDHYKKQNKAQQQSTSELWQTPDSGSSASLLNPPKAPLNVFSSDEVSNTQRDTLHLTFFFLPK